MWHNQQDSMCIKQISREDVIDKETVMPQRGLQELGKMERDSEHLHQLLWATCPSKVAQ